MLASTVACASLPVVGKHLEPLGSAAAMGIWGCRHLPEFLATTTATCLTPGITQTRRQERDDTVAVTVAALQGIVSAAELDADWPLSDRTAPVWHTLQHRRYRYRADVHYGDSPAQLLDVWRRKDLPVRPAPVLVFVPGGAWVHGSRTLQGYALMSHLAERGWVCLAINYRVAPHHRWPRPIADVKTAIAWARANVDKFGGDRDFVAVAGCSAGGHLAALAGLAVPDPQYEAQLPAGANTSVDAVIGIYGRYDWQDRSTAERERFVDFLERVVVNQRIASHPEIFHDASPMTRVHAQAPPFLVIHGSRDSVVPVAQARSFAQRLRAVSDSEVGYLELPGAGHGFDLIDGLRAGAMAHAITLFLNQVHRSRSQIGPDGYRNVRGAAQQ
ncbi:MAG: alpha/beta hydrolase [Mycobacteriaceae bacterium]|nr:alpha/beta hydrolase [Mycobacteriaceae bacterium]